MGQQPRARLAVAGPRVAERGAEFGGFGVYPRVFNDQLAMRLKGDARENTTIAIVNVDVRLNISGGYNGDQIGRASCRERV